MSTYVLVLISPATTQRPVVTIVSHATRPYGSSASTASRTLSLIWSAILSGWPSVTDSDVNVWLVLIRLRPSAPERRRAMVVGGRLRIAPGCSLRLLPVRRDV